MARSISAAAPLDSPAAPRRRLDTWAALCLSVYVLLGLALIARVPLSMAPDEAQHWEYIQHIATTRSLPIFAGAQPPAPGYEFHQPPLYYLLAAPAWAALPAGVQQYSARLAALICGALTVWLVLAGARAMFGEGAVARRAGMLAALWPMHIAIGSSSNNDALAGLCCAALFWRLALLSRRAPDVRDGIWIGALAGLGLLSKSTTLTVSIAAVLALWHLSRRAAASEPLETSSIEREPTSVSTGRAPGTPQVLEAPVVGVAEPGRVLGACVGVALAVCGWMLVRNTMLYGDALVLGAFRQAAEAIAPGLAEFSAPRRVGGLGLSVPGYGGRLLAILFSTCWGFYGGPNAAISALRLFSPSPVWPQGWLLGAALVLLAASTYVAAWGLGFVWRVVGRMRSGSGSARDCVLLWCAVAVLLVALAWLQFALAHFAGAQARYLHAALLPVCLLAARAWDGLPRPARAPLSWVLALVMLALTLANVLEWRTLDQRSEQAEGAGAALLNRAFRLG